MMKSYVSGVLVVISIATASSAQASPADAASSNLRFENARIAEGIEFARRRSPAFRDLLAAITDSDLIVYMQDGGCRAPALPSCLRIMPTPGARRVVIAVQPRETLRTMIRQLAHELRHAAEIAAAPDVVNDASLRQLYERIGFQNCGPALNECWETREAIDLEARVAEETFAHARPTIAATGRQTLSRDGLSLVISTRTRDGRPEPAVSTTVWEKQRPEVITFVATERHLRLLCGSPVFW